MADIIRHPSYSILGSNGVTRHRVTLKQYAPTLRFEVIVDGEVRGWGFATREDADERAREWIREQYQS